ncbi:hypothetical protein TRIATDRAFT_298580 [Trichoderma atroviride IMI 206040]|uniref:Uncharacterized protein n=1 Tax=Hypocrea atroviridis (strain ATCC 20476 / IMI 206040) TaxID=452589 RepID=G9NPH0_HYPAI|nr:uncharacterized protein TRIATDRAFT_298580 [Trichoderma atroviride IMI 206040]EHK47439.1 hypothetical protein TRIATDRAFT_298580 [Trichoderma atroviride IMI 206040]
MEEEVIERPELAELRMAIAPLVASIAVIGGRERCMTKAAFLVRAANVAHYGNYFTRHYSATPLRSAAHHLFN